MERIDARAAAAITGDTLRTIQAKSAQGLVPSAAKNFAGHWTYDEARLRLWVTEGKPDRPPPEPDPDRSKTGHTPGQVYLVNCRGLVKIGWSKNVGARLRQIQKGTPYPVELVRTIPGDMRLELWLHERFKQQRAHGEWFRRTGPLARWMEAGCPL